MSKNQTIDFDEKHNAYLVSRQGSILAYSLIILSMMIAIATSLSVSTIIGKKGASGTEFSAQSLQTADSGVQKALKIINGNSGANLEKAINDGSNFGGTCSDAPGATMIAQSISGAGTYDLKFYKTGGITPVMCADLTKDIGMIKSVGKYKDTVRAVSVVVAAACIGTASKDGITYGTILAKDGKCWLDRNLGARSFPYVVTALGDNDGFGWLFQWGRSADGHQIINPVSGEIAGPSTLLVPGNKFLTMVPSDPGDSWSWYNGVTPSRATLWQGVAGINNPCPAGFRLPTQSEWTGLIAFSAENITNNASAFASSINLTAPGWRRYDGVGSFSAGDYGYYWASDNANKIGLFISNGGIDFSTTATQAFGYSVRCIKG